jgi:hypothetical protein
MMTKRLILLSFVAVAFLAGAVLVIGQDVPKSTDKKVTEVKADKACTGQAGQVQGVQAAEHKCSKDGKCANHKEGEKECACKAASAAMDSTACKAMKVENKDCCGKK